ncbi:MAG: cadmium-translocating P-type ATPase [Rickettsiales bacterium]|nr:cadmium-translocating P-type ATPase [Rickettsiales bacterium]
MNNKKDLFFITFSLILFIFECVLSNIVLQLLICIIACFSTGKSMFTKAIKSIKRKNLSNENVLMALSVIGALIIKEFPEAVMIMLFTQIGHFFQDYATTRTRKLLTDLMNIKPEYATVFKDNDWLEIEPNEVKINDIILIKSGEKIPLDSIVVDGKSTIDLSNITGESIPVDVENESKLISGSINLNGVLKAKVIAEFKDSTVSKILELVENIGSKKTDVENFVSKFTYYYTPVIIILSFIVAILPPLFFENQTFYDWFYKAIALLVMSCPCAIIISIPLALFGGIGVASKNGILIKGGNYLEMLQNIKYIVFDKTGTITKGTFKITKVYNVENKITRDDLLKSVTLLESHSMHPIAQSIKNAYNGILDLSIVSEIKEFHGLGITGKINNDYFIVGNIKFIKQFNINVDIIDDSGVVLYVVKNNEFVGYLLIGDEIKENVKNVINELKNNKIKKTIILSGDNINNVKKVANDVGVDEYFAELLPIDKVNKVEELQSKLKGGEKLVFVGDGVNDSPVLMKSNIGIAMGGVGADVAVESADVVIMNDDISKILYLIKLSKKVMQIIKGNMFLTIGSKIFILFFTLFGSGSIWLSVVLGEGMSVVSILNAIRVFNIKDK